MNENAIASPIKYHGRRINADHPAASDFLIFMFFIFQTYADSILEEQVKIITSKNSAILLRSDHRLIIS